MDKMRRKVRKGIADHTLGDRGKENSLEQDTCGEADHREKAACTCTSSDGAVGF